MKTQDIVDRIAIAVRYTDPAETRKAIRSLAREWWDFTFDAREKHDLLLALTRAEAARYKKLGKKPPDPPSISEVIKRVPAQTLVAMMVPHLLGIGPGKEDGFESLVLSIGHPDLYSYKSGKSTDPEGYVWGGIKNYERTTLANLAATIGSIVMSGMAPAIMPRAPATTGTAPTAAGKGRLKRSKPKSTTTKKGTTKMSSLKTMALSDKPLQTIVYACILAFSRVIADRAGDAAYAKEVWQAVGKSLQDGGCAEKLLRSITSTLNAMSDTKRMPAFPVDEKDTIYDATVKEIADAIAEGLVINAAGEAVAEPEAGLPSLAITIDPAMKPALDAVFPKSNKEGIGFDDFMKRVQMASVAATRINDMEKELMALRSRAAFAAPASASGPLVGTSDGRIPNGKIVMKSAVDIFKSCTHGTHVEKMLGFDIPTYEWDAPHPHVPFLNDHFFTIDKLVPMLWALLKNKPMWTHGPTGSGKSTGWMQAAARMGWPVSRVNFDAEITRLEFVGRDTLKTDGAGHTISEFIEGVLPMAMSGPNILLLDEIDFVRPEVAAILMPVLEPGTPLIVAENGGKVIRPHEMFRVVATSNTKGAGDETRTYQGTRPQSAALRNRFIGGFIEVTYLSNADEVALVKSKVPGVTDKIAKTIVKLATEVRTLFKNGDIIETCSPRDLFSIAETQIQYHSLTGDEKTSLRKAVELHLLGRCGDNDGRAIDEAFQRVAA